MRGQVLAEDVEAGSCSYKVGTKTSIERENNKKKPVCISISLIKVAFCRGWQAQSDLCN